MVLDDILIHYGMPRRSGRYPWGSGENPYQHGDDFISRVKKLKEAGMTEVDIAKQFGMTTGELRSQYSIANNERKQRLADQVKSMRGDGYTWQQISDKLGLAGESSARALLKERAERKRNEAKNAAAFLKKMCDEKGMIDVGAGTEFSLNISPNKLKNALDILKEQGYEIYGGGTPQVTNPGKQTNLRVLCPPGTPHKEIYNFDKIHMVGEEWISHDGGDTFDPKWVYPKSMDSKRLQIRYSEDGGINKDGVIELRRGVDDLSLGNSSYSQVRILVDGTHYLKGMAVYSDNMPDGVDVIFNTNKKKGTPMTSVLKPISNDPDNPFGSLIKEGINDPDIPGDTKGGQSYYIDKNGKKQLSLINKRADEGDWDEWSKKLPSQFLSKQNINLAKRQLDLEISNAREEYNDIMSLTNPTIKRALLNDFASGRDATAVSLQAAALPRQRYQVILPMTTIKDTEVYAPNYRDGENVALIRFPHGGIFELPILKVNNKLKEGRDVLGPNPKDAVGISKAVADRLSGADFDGDTVLVIPANNHGSNVHITSLDPKTTKALKELSSFDPKAEYGGKPEGTFNHMTKKLTQTEMGKVSNLITDMTIRKADWADIAKAVKHSMVVIDAHKHGLDWKQSEKDNDIALLKKKYQGRIEDGKYREGARTLISRSSGEVDVPKRRGDPDILPDGSLSWKTAYPDKLYYTDKKGKVKMRTQKSTQMAETKDARTLSSGQPMEEIYAAFANENKALANQARRELLKKERLKYQPSAAKTYSTEVASLNAKLNTAKMNQPLERKAQLMANSTMIQKMKADPDLKRTSKEYKKMAQQALTAARTKVGAKRHPIDITDREWEAIQSGAISDSKLEEMLKYTDTDKLRQRATPRYSTSITPANINKIKNMKRLGYTNDEIATSLDISTTTVRKYL